MKQIASILALLLFALPAFSAPAWWTALHGQYLTEQELAQVTFPQAPVSQPVATPVTASCPAGFVCTPNPPKVAAPVTVSIPIPSSPISYSPSVLVTGGGGFASPNGKFAYGSISTQTGPQSTYLTAAQEFTMVKGQVQSCTLGGLSKSIYQFGPALIGLTGLAGGCNSTSGTASVAASGQGFLLFRFRKTPYSVVITALKNTTGGFKVTAGMGWGK